jgi:endonuclease/exonuclease/phosphatase family metal-dependent hydrolase
MPFRFILFLLAVVPGAGAWSAETLRVMSYNVHHGEGLDGKLDLERIARVILDAKADVVALQEVDRGVERTQRRDLPAELAQLTGLTVRFDRNIVHQGGDYGNAVLSRFPIRRAVNTPLTRVGQGEQRGIQQLVLDVKGREVLFLNTHLDARRDPAERDRSVAEIREIVARAGSMPVIACGDFNAAPDSVAIGVMRSFLTDTWTVVGQGPGHTVPVRKPTRRIDYVWITPASLVPVTMAVLASEASDHLPIVAELKLLP